MSDNLPSEEFSLTKCSVYVNAIEITSAEDWHKVIRSVAELRSENERLREALTKIAKHPTALSNFCQLLSNPPQNSGAYELIQIALSALRNKDSDNGT